MTIHTRRDRADIDQDVSPYVDAFNKAAALLDDLPDTADGVADFLMEKGVKAVCGESEKCAVADYLWKEVPLPEGITWSVDTYQLEVGFSEGYRQPRQGEYRFLNMVNNEYSVENPPTVTEFIREFDNENYPDLEMYEGDYDDIRYNNQTV